MSSPTIVTINPVEKASLKRFVSLERKLMSTFPKYISEIDEDVIKFLTGKVLMAKNSEFELFIAQQNGQDVARCAAIINRTFQAQKQPGSGFIGFFAAADSCEDAVNELFQTAESWLKARGVTKVIAPSNGGAPNAMGFLVTGFDEDPMFPFPWSPPYYPAYIEALGYQPTYPLWYYEVDFSSKKFQSAKARYIGYDQALIRPASKKNWDRDIDTITDLLNETFVHEWEFNTLGHEEMREFFGPMKDVLDARQILIAEVGGKAQGFCFALPDLTPLFRTFNGSIGIMAIFKLVTGATKKFNRAGILGIGVSESQKGKGLAKAIAVKMYEFHESLGLKSSLYYPVNESNTDSRGFAESIGGTGRKMYQVYTKEIG